MGASEHTIEARALPVHRQFGAPPDGRGAAPPRRRQAGSRSSALGLRLGRTSIPTRSKRSDATASQSTAFPEGRRREVRGRRFDYVITLSIGRGNTARG